MRTPPGFRVFAVAFVIGHATGPAATLAQDRCVLRIDAPRRASTGAPDTGTTTYLSGGTVTLRCGGAVMTGDSAVYYETEERAEMIGTVNYRDTTRTLSAERLTYFEPTGQVLATGDVRLVRLANRATLEGPRVSFFRAGSVGGRTIASERPHMTIPPRDGGEAIGVDADETEFVGDTLAIGRGDVVISRSDFDATADSARMTAAVARLFGRPVVTARGMRLEGDSLHAGLAPGGIDRVHAFGDAKGEGEEVELDSDEIVVAWADGEVHRIEAFGEGRALAGARDFVVAGDSLDVAFTAGAVDSVTAVGQGRTFQLAAPRADGDALAEPRISVSDPMSWIEGDSIRAWLARGAPAPADDAESAAGEAETEIRRLLAIGSARSYFAAVRDSLESDRPSRNYIIGETIDIAFVDGEPEEVEAVQAIGVFLEPSEGAAAAVDTAAAAAPPETP